MKIKFVKFKEPIVVDDRNAYESMQYAFSEVELPGGKMLSVSLTETRCGILVDDPRNPPITVPYDKVALIQWEREPATSKGK